MPAQGETMDDSRGYGITIEQMAKVGEPNKHIISRIVSREVKEKIEKLICTPSWGRVDSISEIRVNGKPIGDFEDIGQ